jgi:DNA-binding PadR family transcriptional regulator
MTSAEVAVLGLVAEQSRYGYEIEAVIEERGMREWTEIGFSSIYYILGKLEKAGYLESKLEFRGAAPPRKVYSITDAGLEALRTEVGRLLSNPPRSFAALDVGIANLKLLPRKEVLAHLETYLESLRERRKKVRTKFEAQGAEALPFHAVALFTHAFAHIDAEIAWVEDLLKVVRSQRDWFGEEGGSE